MADKDEEKQPDKKQEKPEQLEKEQGKSEQHYDYRKSGWLLPVMTFVVVISLAGMFGSMVAYHHERQNTVLSPRLGGMRSGIIQRNHAFSGFGGTVVNADQNVTSGVVTNVNGSSFTVAGNGSTQQVATDGSTQYQSGNQVKVNDTVIVYGTTTNNTLTATQIIINP
jgi:hypothetical protein